MVTMTPEVQAIYQRLLVAVKAIGPFQEDPKKTSIHLTRRTAFAGVATRKNALILTVKSAADIKSPRIVKHQHASKDRWYLDVRLEHPKHVDAELKSWLEAAMKLAG